VISMKDNTLVFQPKGSQKALKHSTGGQYSPYFRFALTFRKINDNFTPSVKVKFAPEPTINLQDWKSLLITGTPKSKVSPYILKILQQEKLLEKQIVTRHKASYSNAYVRIVQRGGRVCTNPACKFVLKNGELETHCNCRDSIFGTFPISKTESYTLEELLQNQWLYLPERSFNGNKQFGISAIRIVNGGCEGHENDIRDLHNGQIWIAGVGGREVNEKGVFVRSTNQKITSNESIHKNFEDSIPLRLFIQEPFIVGSKTYKYHGLWIVDETKGQRNSSNVVYSFKIVPWHILTWDSDEEFNSYQTAVKTAVR